MTIAVKRSMKTSQPGLRSLFIQLNGTLVTPTATKFDASAVNSVVDNGAGSYTVILKKAFHPENADNMMVFAQVLTDNDIDEVIISAVDYDRFTVECFAAGVATDCDLFIQMVGSDNRLSY